jgi:hypothetical protein
MKIKRLTKLALGSPQNEARAGINSLLSSFILLALVPILVSCATRMFNAKKLQEAGMYEESAKLYEEELAKSPDNLDAKIGLYSIRREIVRKELVSIRLMRISGSEANAANRLEAFLGITKGWDRTVYSSADVTAEQDEVAKARFWISTQVDKLLTQKHPLLAEDLIYKYPNLMSSIHYGDSRRTASLRARSEGASHCRELSQQVVSTSYAFSEVLKNYCRYFGVDPDLKALNPTGDYRFSYVGVSGRIRSSSGNSLKNDYLEALASNLNSKLRDSKMYRENSPVKLQISVSGEFSYIYNNGVVEKTHSYSERVPFQATEDYHDVEYETVFQPQIRPVTLPNGMVTLETEMVPTTVPREVLKTRVVTRYKDIPRAYRYNATRHNQDFRLAITLTERLTKQTSSKTFSDSKQFETHEESLPHIELYPSSDSGIEINSWVTSSISQMSEEFVHVLGESQRSLFCDSVDGEHAKSHQAEMISRCQQLEPGHLNVTIWFNSVFGYSGQQFFERIKLKGS